MIKRITIAVLSLVTIGLSANIPGPVIAGGAELAGSSMPADEAVICVYHLNLTQNVSGIYRIYRADHSIVASNSITGGAYVTYGANVSVKMTTGFKVTSGSRFKATLIGCIADELPKPKSAVESQGTPDLDESASLQTMVYPNPSSAVFSIEIRSAVGEPEITLLNLAGEIIFRQSNVEQNTNIDLSDYPDGVYILKVSDTNKVTSTRLIKN